MSRRRMQAANMVAAFSLLLCFSGGVAWTQGPDEAGVIRGIDAAVNFRYKNVLGFTDVEHYSVFKGQDETHPIAEMTVKDTYRKGVGKTYTILSESGPELVRRLGLRPLLENEKAINEPAKVERSWFDSANYEMHLKPGGVQRLDGRDCYAVAMSPRRKAPNTIAGTVWVDAKDYSVVKIEGTASKSPSIFAGATRMMREYKSVNGFPMAVHARAESSSIVGRIVVTIDYSDYQIQSQ